MDQLTPLHTFLVRCMQVARVAQMPRHQSAPNLRLQWRACFVGASCLPAGPPETLSGSPKTESLRMLCTLSCAGAEVLAKLRERWRLFKFPCGALPVCAP